MVHNLGADHMQVMNPYLRHGNIPPRPEFFSPTFSNNAGFFRMAREKIQTPVNLFPVLPSYVSRRGIGIHQASPLAIRRQNPEDHALWPSVEIKEKSRFHTWRNLGESHSENQGNFTIKTSFPQPAIGGNLWVGGVGSKKVRLLTGPGDLLKRSCG